MNSRLWPGLALGALVGVAGPQLSVVAQEQTAGFELEDFEFWAEQCLLLSTETDYQKTQETCEQAISLEPKDDNLALWFARSHALFHLGQHVEAIASFGQVLKVAPNDSISLTYQCASQYQLSQLETAVDTCEQALRLDGSWGTDSPALAWYYRGLALQAQGRLETALASYSRALTLTPDDLMVQAGRCAVASELGLYDQCSLAEAVIAYEQALAANPDDATLWFQQGLALEQLGRYAQALTAYGGAIAIKPDHSLALVHQCAVLNELKDYETALATCDTALAGDGNWNQLGPVVAWSQRSAAQIGLEDYEAALASAERAIAINPNYPGGWNNRAVGLWHQGELDAAQVAIKAAYDAEQTLLPLFSEDFNRDYTESPIFFQRRRAVTAYNEGTIFLSLYAATPWAQNHAEQASSAYQRALDIHEEWQPKLMIDPYNLAGNVALPVEGALLADPFLARLWTNFAIAEFYSGRLSSAEYAANRAIDHNSESFDVWYNLGTISLQANAAPIEVWDAFANAALIDPESAAPLVGQGMTLVNAACYPEALQVFEQVLNLDPNNLLAQQQHSELTQLSAVATGETDGCPIVLQ